MMENKDKKKSIKEFKNIYKLIKEDKGKMVFAFICVFLSSMLSITNGWLQGKVTEEIVAKNLKTSLIFLLIYFIIDILFNNLLSNIGVMISSKIEAKLSKKLSIMVYKKSLNLPAYAFEEKTSGELINRITSDTETLSNTFNSIIQTLINAFGCLLILIYIFFNSVVVGMEIVIFLIVIFAITKIFNPKIKKINQELKAKKDDYTALSAESIRGIREIKTLGIKKNLISEISSLRELIYKKDTEDINLHRTYSIIMWAIKILLESLVFATCVIGI